MVIISFSSKLNKIVEVRIHGIYFGMLLFIVIKVYAWLLIFLTRNIGHDGSGLHCRENKTIQNELININPINYFPDTVMEDLITLKKMKNYIKKTYSFRRKIFRFIMSKF